MDVQPRHTPHSVPAAAAGSGAPLILGLAWHDVQAGQLGLLSTFGSTIIRAHLIGENGWIGLCIAACFGIAAVQRALSMMCA